MIWARRSPKNIKIPINELSERNCKQMVEKNRSKCKCVSIKIVNIFLKKVYKTLQQMEVKESHNYSLFLTKVKLQ